MKTLKKMHGVTLVELMITVSTAALALGLGVPAFGGIQTSMQRGQAISEIVSSFTLARSEAARRGVSVSICASTDGQTCADGDLPNWRTGWIVFTDADENHVADNDDEIIHVARFEQTAFSIVPPSTAGATESRPHGVTFRGTGYPDVAGTFNYCDSGASRGLDLNYLGRININESDSGCS
jgi:type IV fimbrial biogenesis protein FimT